MKDYVAAVRRLPPSKQDAVLEGLEPLLKEVEQASNLAWLPVSLNLQLTEAVFRALGDEAADAFYQSWLKRQMNAPAFSGLVRTALSLFRFDTAAIARWIPKAFDLMYRDYGSFVIDTVSPLQVNVELRDVPRELMTHGLWQRSVCSGMYALFFLTGVKGTVELSEANAKKRTLLFTLCWA
ncbi:MAG: hypothetical protein K0R38_4061 [Polyangiaceae bacterium]|jgi:hypothetical protein|nr:hypothetical protein [Polyangiaceae bacterium]